MSEWVVKPGDTLRVFSPEGDPRDPSTDLSQAYVVPEPFLLQPSYFTNFITTLPFSTKEIEELESVLSSKMPKRLLAEVERAIDEFVCTIALQSRMATWKQIEDRLVLILEACEKAIVGAQALLELTSFKVLDDSVFRGVLSADQLVRRMLMDRVDFENIKLNVDLDPILIPCIRALEDVKKKNKRGRKPEVVFRLFLSRLSKALDAEGLKLTVPSNDNVFDKAPPTFVFVTKVLDLCIDKGKAAVVASELDQSEKDEAVRALSHYRKSSRALVHYFRDGPLT
ncbi:hypothetical protein LFADAHJC_LOCUS2379 [Methylorubrum extorquens]